MTNEKLAKALRTGVYVCPECGSIMEFENEETRDILICTKCGFDEDIDYYGNEDKSYEELYPTLEEVLGVADEDDDIYDELDD